MIVQLDATALGNVEGKIRGSLGYSYVLLACCYVAKVLPNDDRRPKEWLQFLGNPTVDLTISERREPDRHTTRWKLTNAHTQNQLTVNLTCQNIRNKQQSPNEDLCHSLCRTDICCLSSS